MPVCRSAPSPHRQGLGLFVFVPTRLGLLTQKTPLPAAPTALRAYADASEKLGLNAAFVADVRALAEEFEAYRKEHGQGDPSAVPHRKDDPVILAKMKQGKST